MPGADDEGGDSERGNGGRNIMFGDRFQPSALTAESDISRGCSYTEFLTHP
jgi:hypothetical protein